MNEVVWSLGLYVPVYLYILTGLIVWVGPTCYPKGRDGFPLYWVDKYPRKIPFFFFFPNRCVVIGKFKYAKWRTKVSSYLEVLFFLKDFFWGEKRGFFFFSFLVIFTHSVRHELTTPASRAAQSSSQTPLPKVLKVWGESYFWGRSMPWCGDLCCAGECLPLCPALNV